MTHKDTNSKSSYTESFWLYLIFSVALLPFTDEAHEMWSKAPEKWMFENKIHTASFFLLMCEIQLSRFDRFKSKIIQMFPNNCTSVSH